MCSIVGMRKKKKTVQNFLLLTPWGAGRMTIDKPKGYEEKKGKDMGEAYGIFYS